MDERAVSIDALNPDAPFDDLAPVGRLVERAAVVGLGTPFPAVEFGRVVERVVRYLVDVHDFRVVALEEPPFVGRRLDALIGGEGQVDAPVEDSFTPVRVPTFVDLLRWMQRWNQRAGGARLHILGADVAAEPGADPDLDPDRGLASAIGERQERTGERVIYLGGIAHVVSGAPVTAPSPTSPAPDLSAGAHLRSGFGGRYVPIGMSAFDGRGAEPLPPAAPGTVESVLASAERERFFLDLRRGEPEDELDAWVEQAACTRVIGPHYVPERDDDYYTLSGQPLGSWLDAVFHLRTVTPSGLPARPTPAPQAFDVASPADRPPVEAPTDG